MSKKRKTNRTMWLLVFVCVVFGMAVASAQKTTEQYVPIGQSPGVSYKYSAIGKIVAVDRIARTITVKDNSGTRSFEVTVQTRIWLDRSKAKRENRPAGYEDCKVGQKVEVMHLHDDEDVADWIKIKSR